MKRVLVFGVFDNLHEGHRSFLRQAKALGDFLVVAVAQDEAVQNIKKRAPRATLSERIASVRAEHIADEVISGDPAIGSWQVVDAQKPDIIALGYDQADLRRALETAQRNRPWRIAFVTLVPYEPEKYKSSIVNG